MREKYPMLTIGVILLLLAGMLTVRKQRLSRQTPPTSLPVLDTAGKNPSVKRIKTLINEGGRVDWSSQGDLVAFDRIGEDGYYNVWVMKPDGSEQRCLTCGRPGLPNKHIGQPAWHPSGAYLVFQAQKEHRGLGKITDSFATPGLGINNDLWLMKVDGNDFRQLTNVQEGVGGVLHPHFSHNGNKLLWSERISAKGGKWGQWALKIADFVVENQNPRLENIETFQPGEQHLFYESHGFTQDDKGIIFSGNLEAGQDETGMDVYLMDIETGGPIRLTNTLDEWDEHAQLSPDGRKIAWASSKNYEVNPNKPDEVCLDLWLMNIDGTEKKRLTYFNDPSAPEYLGRVTAGDSAWSPDGKTILVYVLYDGKKQLGSVLRINLE